MDRVDYQSLIVQDLLNDHRDQKLNLTPWYQRRSVWTRPQKSYLINTLFERKPIPALYIRHSIDIERGQSVKEVVDGQQRARAILEYCNNEYSAKLSIQGQRLTFAQLDAQQRERFLLTPLPIGYLLGATDADVIDIFARINSVSKTLNFQERRNAQFSGEFKQFCLAETTRRLEFWRNLNIFSANDIARMNEVQFISDLVLNMVDGLSDFRQTDLDNIYRNNDENFPQSGDISQRLDEIFEVLYSLSRDTITDTIFQRPPLLFSLLIVMDRLQVRNPRTLEQVLRDIDAAYSDDDLNDEDVAGFRRAVTSSTQRIASRRIRDEFISRHF